MAVFAYQYTYDSTKTEEMDAIRPLHRGYLGEGAKAGKVLASGPFAGGKVPSSSSVLIPLMTLQNLWIKIRSTNMA